jgi:hypothetical protein
MMTYDLEQRAINLVDAAGRANSNGLPDLALKLSMQAEKILSPMQHVSGGVSVTIPAETDPSQVAFEAYAAGRGLNIEKHHGDYVSSGTRERWWYWQASAETHAAIQDEAK